MGYFGHFSLISQYKVTITLQFHTTIVN